MQEAIASRKSGSEGRRPKGSLFHQNILIVYIITFKISWEELYIIIGFVIMINDGDVIIPNFHFSYFFELFQNYLF